MEQAPPEAPETSKPDGNVTLIFPSEGMLAIVVNATLTAPMLPTMIEAG